MAAYFLKPPDQGLYTALHIKSQALTSPYRTIRLKEPTLGPFKAHRGEFSAGIGAGIDPDSAAALLDFVRNGVAVDDDFLERCVGIQELLANPAEIAWLLLIERDSRPHAGMDEGIVADDDQILESRQEVDMRLRHPRAHHRQQLGIVGGAIFGLADAIAQDGGLAADSHEEGQRLGVALQ